MAKDRLIRNRNSGGDLKIQDSAGTDKFTLDDATGLMAFGAAAPSAGSLVRFESGTTAEYAVRAIGASDGHGINIAAGSSASEFAFLVQDQAGNNMFQLDGAGSIVINDDSKNGTSVRIEGDTQTNLFHVNGSTDSIGIGIAGSSTARLHVSDAGTDDTACYIKANKDASYAGTVLDVEAERGSNSAFNVAEFTYAAGAVSAMLIRGDGNIGINQSTPTARLHVEDAGTDDTAARIHANKDAGYAGTVLDVEATRGSNSAFNVAKFTYNGGVATAFIIRGDSRTGINTTSLPSMFNVEWDSTSDFTALIKNDAAAGSSRGLRIEAGGTGADYNMQCFQRDGSTQLFAIQGDGQVVVNIGNWDTGGTAVGVSGGTLTTSPSSLRYKENIDELGKTIDSSRIYDLHAVTFDYKIDGRHSFGYIAEEVNEVLPCLVNKEEDENGNLVPESVSYAWLAVLAVEEMKKLKVEAEAKDIQIGQMQDQLSTLTQLVDDLRNQ